MTRFRIRAAALVVVSACALSAVLVAGRAGADVTGVSFSPANRAAGAATTWTISFNTSQGNSGALSAGSKITVTFPSGTGIPASPTISNASGFGSCTATASGSGTVVTVTLATNGCQAKNTVPTFTLGSITNPPAGTYTSTLSVSTTTEPSAISPTTGVVIYGAPAKLFFSSQPGGGTGGSAFGSQPAVTVQDANGAIVPTDTSAVTLAITSGTGTSGASLGCTANPTSAVSGVASFAGCKIDKAGTGYTLTATDGSLTAAVSSSFAVTVGAASKLGFAVQPPATGTAGSTLTSFKVAVQDAGGNTVSSGTGSTDVIGLTVASGPSSSFGTGSTTSATAAAGLATFGNVNLTAAGSYTLTATDSSRTLTTATSSTVVISAAAASKLAFGQGPSDVATGAAIAPTVTVQLQDQYGNPTSTSGVTVSLTSSAGVLAAGGSATTSAAGLASFSAAQLNTAATGLTLTASASGLTSVTSSTFTVYVPVTNGAALTDTAADTGSGVQRVSYYYCAGYTGSCTSANWTLIGSSTSAAGSYPVSWTGQPASGAYRLVTVAVDNVTNASAPSASIPVKVG